MPPSGGPDMPDPRGTPPDDGDSGQFNFVKEALKWQYNIIGLGAAGAFALVSGSALPLVALLLPPLLPEGLTLWNP